MPFGFGTLHLVAVGRQRAIICSDSRGYDAAPIPDVDFRKGFQAGERTFLGIAGLLRYPASAIIRRVTPNDFGPWVYLADHVGEICEREDLQDSPEALLATVGQELYPSVYRQIYVHNPLPDEASGAFVFSAFTFSRNEAGVCSLRELQFPVTGVGGGRKLGEPKFITHLERAIPFGPFLWFLGKKIDRSIQLKNPDSEDSAVLRSVDEMYEGAKKLDGKGAIGGSIDVAAIDRQGFRWLRAKRDVPVWASTT